MMIALVTMTLFNGACVSGTRDNHSWDRSPASTLITHPSIAGGRSHITHRAKMKSFAEDAMKIIFGKNGGARFTAEDCEQ